MAVIDTSMDMPKSCYDCYKKSVCFFAQCNGWIDNKRDDDCPLKSTDEMNNEIEVEIEKNRMNALEYYGLSHALRIINKYCKENKDGEP